MRHVKLYNSGNFFDAQAIPPEEFASIASRLAGMRTVIVENHPRLCGESCLRFRDHIDPACQLEVALGLETAHPELLARLNKRMTVADFQRAVSFLGRHKIASRAFVLLRPPFLSEAEGVEWSLRTIDLAFSAGVRCCSIIATRKGNGIMEQLQSAGQFSPPELASLELVLETALQWKRGRVFADLWDISAADGCPHCRDARLQRLRVMNLTQSIPPRIACDCRPIHA